MVRTAALRRLLPLLLLVLIAAAPAAPPISREQAAAALSVLENPQSRNAFIATLQTIVQGTTPTATSGHAAAAAPAPAATATPAAKPTTAAAAHKPPSPALPLAPNSLGAQSLVQFSAALTATRRALLRAARAVVSVSLLSIWLATVKGDPFVQQEFLAFAWRVIVVLALGLAAEQIAIWALGRGRRAALRLARRERANAPGRERRAKTAAKDTPQGPKETGPRVREARVAGEFRAFVHRVRSVGYALGAFALDIPPIALFAAVAYGVLETRLGAPAVPRLSILAIVNAYAVTRFVLCVVRLVLADEAAEFRLLPTSDASAAYAMLWARRIVAVSAFGYAATVVTPLYGLYDSLRLALVKLVALVVHVFLAIIILQQRRAVCALISPPREATGLVAALRRVVARFWHYVAIFYVMALWLLWAIGVPNGFTTLLRFLLTAFVVIVAAWGARQLLIRFISHHLHVQKGVPGRYPGYERRVRRYVNAAQRALSLVVSLIAFVVLLELWNVDAISWFFSGGFGGRIMGALVVIGVTVAAALFIWEVTNAAIERHLARLARDGQAARAARINTLLPMVRATLVVAIAVFVGLTALSEVGVDIAPLLAGAGVIGIAIGFGSQKLVQDVITGVFLLFENAMQVGDVVTLGGLSGVVENVSVRSIRLRDSDGSVYLIPFSAVSTVANQTRDFGYAVFNVSIAYDEDADRVIGVLKEIVHEMRDEPAWRAMIRNELEVWGLDKLSATSQVIACRVQTGPTDRWAVGREFNRRMKQRFDELGIEMSYPTQKLVMDKDASRYSNPEEKNLPRGVLP